MPWGRRHTFSLAGILAVLFLTASFTSRADADAKVRFDLPIETLDKALRDLALQAHCNIGYEPSVVAGLQAPAIKGDFTAAEALTRLLVGTRLVGMRVDEDTIRVVEKGQGILQSPGSARLSDEAGTGDSDAGKSDISEIVVTGSHIRGVSSAAPVIEIGRDEIDRSGYTSISDLMLSLPQNFGGGYSPSAAVANSPTNLRYSDNFTGASVPNLRGLGPGSTLTLIDGHRMASGLSAGGSDISSIPLDAVERIEVVTDGASSIYGSDAVAGVVNIILRKDYQGADTKISYGFASQGGGSQREVSQLFGTSWSSGNIMIGYEHMQQDAVDAEDRAFTSSATQPYSLLPETKSNALTLAASQDIGYSAHAFAEGLLVSRDADSFVSEAGLPGAIQNPSTLRKYAVAAGITSNLWSDWSTTVFANAAEDASEDDSSYLTLPSLTPGGDVREIGTLRSIEANANGSVFRLPSGPVRLAVGIGYQNESFSELYGTTGSAFFQRDDGDRNIRYEFFELSVPLVEHSAHRWLERLDLTVSARDERYSDFGNKAVPKVGLVYSPVGAVKLRSTWSRAYKAPNLEDMHGLQQLAVLDLLDPASPSGSSAALVKIGGNPALQPESADTLSFGMDYAPPSTGGGLLISATGFDIKYSNRIAQLGNPYAALTDPVNAYFVTRAPGAAQAQALYNSYPPADVFSDLNSPFDANSIAAIVDYRVLNVSRQTVYGADFTASYRIGTDSAGALLFFNGSYLDLQQQDTPQSPTETLAGLAFYPARIRARGGVTWNRAGWSLTGTANYLAHETNTEVVPEQRVGSWTTVDAALKYTPTLPGVFSGLRLSLAVINLFDRDPPRVLTPDTVTGVNLDYDAANTNPLGRLVSLSVSKKW
jgi:iron complex outermembrane receptor protein